MKWMWSLSAVLRGTPWRTRRSTAAPQSTIGISIRVTGTMTVCRVAAPPMSSRGRSARVKPSRWLPESPMKIDAGGRLCARKPHAAPNTATATTAVMTCPWSRAMTAIPPAVKAAMPPARPSRPSIRFTELTMPTIHSTVTGTAATPSCTWPRTGRAMESTRMPASAVRVAITICSSSLVRARNGTKSSNSPTAKISAAPANTASRGGCSPARRVSEDAIAAAPAPAPAVMARKIARPPMRGMRPVCSLRESGRSYHL